MKLVDLPAEVLDDLCDEGPCLVVCTVDLDKRDAEIKVLLGCTAEEKKVIGAFHTGVSAAALLIERLLPSEPDS